MRRGVPPLWAHFRVPCDRTQQDPPVLRPCPPCNMRARMLLPVALLFFGGEYLRWTQPRRIRVSEKMEASISILVYQGANIQIFVGVTVHLHFHPPPYPNAMYRRGVQPRFNFLGSVGRGRPSRITSQRFHFLAFSRNEHGVVGTHDIAQSHISL